MKKLIIIILVVLIVGLWFIPELTKTVMKKTGKASANLTKEALQEIKDSQVVDDIKTNFKRNLLGNETENQSNTT